MENYLSRTLFLAPNTNDSLHHLFETVINFPQKHKDDNSFADNFFILMPFNNDYVAIQDDSLNKMLKNILMLKLFQIYLSFVKIKNHIKRAH